MKKHSLKRYLLAAIISAISMFFLAGLWNLVIVGGLGLIEIPQNLLRESPILPLVLLGYLALSLVIVFIGSHSLFSSKQILHWMITGALAMETAFGLSGLVLQAYYNFPLSAIPFDLTWYFIEGALGGLIISLLLPHQEAV